MRAAEITRRSALGLLGAGAVAFAALHRPRRDPRARGRTVIDYWEKWTGQEAAAMQRAVDVFNDSQDRIFVRYLSTSAIEQKSLVAIAGGSPPDLIGLWDDRLPAFVRSGAVLPLDELDARWGGEIERAFAERYGDAGIRLVPDRYAPPLWRLMQEDGHIGGAPNTCSTLALYLDRAAMREADLDAAPRTIAELDEAAERLTRFDALGRLQRAGFVHAEPGWWKWIWGHFFGGAIFGGDAITVDTSANRAAFEWVQSYPRRLGVSALAAFQGGFGGYNSVQQPILAGKVAMVLQGPFVANVFREFAPRFDYLAAPFPVAPNLVDEEHPVGMLESDMLCIPRGCAHPREAFEFLMFTQRPAIAHALARAHAKPTPLADPGRAFYEGHPNRFIELHQRLAASRNAFSKPRTRAWPALESEFNVNFPALWHLDLTAPAFAALMQERCTAHLEAQVRREARRRGDSA